MTYGYRIAIHGQINTTDISKITEFSASFKNMSYEGSLNASQKNFFQENDVKISINILSGSTVQDAGTILTSFEEIGDFPTCFICTFPA